MPPPTNNDKEDNSNDMDENNVDMEEVEDEEGLCFIFYCLLVKKKVKGLVP